MCGWFWRAEVCCWFDGAGNELGPSSATCRGAGISPACALTVTWHTSYAAGDGAGLCLPLERRGGVDNASLGGRWRDQSSPRDVGAMVVLLLGENTFVYAGETKPVLAVSALLVFLVGVELCLRVLCRGVWAVRAQAVAWCLLAVVLLLLALSRAFLPLRWLRPGIVVMCLSPRCLFAACLHLNVSRMCLTLSMNSCGSMHGAVMHDNSSGMHVNSCGALGHRNSCNLHAAEVRGGTKAPSMSTRLEVRCLAVEKLASPQQAPGSLHVRYGPASYRTRARRFSGRWKSYRGVQSLWPVLHVLIILLSHLGQAE